MRVIAYTSRSSSVLPSTSFTISTIPFIAIAPGHKTKSETKGLENVVWVDLYIEITNTFGTDISFYYLLRCKKKQQSRYDQAPIFTSCNIDSLRRLPYHQCVVFGVFNKHQKKFQRCLLHQTILKGRKGQTYNKMILFFSSPSRNIWCLTLLKEENWIKTFKGSCQNFG